MIACAVRKKKQTAAAASRRKRLPRFLGQLLLVLGAGVSAQPLSGVTLAWNPSAGSGIAGYRLYQGVASQTYTNVIEVGNVTNATVSGLSAGVTYFFAVTAYDINGLESPFSSEISYTAANSAPPAIVLAAPADGASYTAPASISLAATVAPNGHTLSKVQFYNDLTLLAEDPTAPYTFDWSNVGTGSYSLSARLVYDGGDSLASAPVGVTVTAAPEQPPVAALPAPWQTADVGDVGLAGKASISEGLYSVSGAGNLNGTGDSFRFLYEPLSGDGEIRAQLVSVQDTGANARAGLMMRETLSPGSQYGFMGCSADGAMCWQYRKHTDGNSDSTLTDTGAIPSAWIRLVRSGNTLYGYQSTNGTDWVLVTSKAIPMAKEIYFGLAVASGSPDILNTSTFTNATIIP